MARAVQQLGAAPFGLINNASVFDYDDIDTLDSKTWHTAMATNAYAPVLLAKHLAQALDGRPGCVITEAGLASEKKSGGPGGGTAAARRSRVAVLIKGSGGWERQSRLSRRRTIALPLNWSTCTARMIRAMVKIMMSVW